MKEALTVDPSGLSGDSGSGIGSGLALSCKYHVLVMAVGFHEVINSSVDRKVLLSLVHP